MSVGDPHFTCASTSAGPICNGISMLLSENDAAKIILVRSVEECDKKFFSDQIVLDALAAGKSAEPGLAWVKARAQFLFDHLSPSYQMVRQIARLPSPWTPALCFLMLVLGFLTNLLGPAEKIHHLGALSLALGAVAGMYFQGLFRGYAAIWTSTFITSEAAVAPVVKFIFAPSLWLSQLLGWGLAERIDLARLMSHDGDQAAPWIHSFALKRASRNFKNNFLGASAQYSKRSAPN